MMSNDLAQPYIHNRRRPARSLIFSLGVMFGIVVGVVASFGLADIRLQANTPPAWSSALVCRGHTAGVFFIENNLNRDYALEGNFILMQQAGIGLVPSEARVIIPVFIPQSETAGMRVEDAPKTGLILFDLRNRVRVALN